MRVRSVQFKFLITVISAIMAIAVFVGGVSIYEVDQYGQKETINLLNMTCAKEASQVNDILGDIEKSVRIMESYVLSLFHKAENINDRERQNEILQLSGEMFVDVAANTDGAVAYYLRFDPAISDSKTGMFYTKLNQSNEYVCLEPTDIALYDRDDTEHVGWFWQPYDAGHAIWLDPYYNQNNGIWMISYVIPLYYENQFIGVVGMDFEYMVLTDRIHQIKIYENGFAHLELDGVVIHTGYEIMDGQNLQEIAKDYLQVSEELVNGMTLVISASYDDIKQIRYELAGNIALAAIFLAIIFTLIVVLMVRKIIHPLKKLADASIKLADGDYNVEITHSNTYEIHQLSTAFENMLIKLREHKRLQHILTYRDSLTGLRNTTSYKEWVIDFNNKLQAGDLSFGIAMLDLNYLKETNDTHGHDIGNKLIVTASQIISDTFKRSPVFRIGGDEFVVILQNRDLEEREMLFAKLESECINTPIETDNIKLRVSIAMGFSLFDPATDKNFADVFNRADDEMYKTKKRMKMAQV